MDVNISVIVYMGVAMTQEGNVVVLLVGLDGNVMSYVLKDTLVSVAKTNAQREEVHRHKFVSNVFIYSRIFRWSM